MKRTVLCLAAAAGLHLAAPARADDPTTTPDVDARAAAADALAEKATPPAKPPVLPTAASDRATFVHENIAFGKKGDAERLAHSQAGKKGHDAADDAHADAANRAAHGAAMSAMGSAKDDAHEAAGMARSEDARHSMPGGMTGTGGNGGNGGPGMGHR